MLKAIQLLRSINKMVGLACGFVLLLTAAFVLIEITLRALALPNMGGADEYSGYVMAGVTAWGLSFALTEKAHIRIDMAVNKLRPLLRDMIDVIALSTLAAVAVTVSIYGWTVVARSIKSASRANTPLETPLWIPQLIWWSGWFWFAITASVISVVAVALLVGRRSDELRALAGGDENRETRT